MPLLFGFIVFKSSLSAHDAPGMGHGKEQTVKLKPLPLHIQAHLSGIHSWVGWNPPAYFPNRSIVLADPQKSL